MIKNIKEILIEQKIHIFYNIETREFFLINLRLNTKTQFENMAHLYENLVFQMELLFNKTLMFKKDDLNSLLIKVNGTTYKPTQELIYINTTQKLVNLNYPKSFIAQLDYNITEIEELKAKFPMILTILDNLCENKKKSLNWVLDWFSYIVRYNLGLETKKVNTSILFYGGQGSGKNLFINGVIELFIKTKELSQNDLENPFNYYLVESNLITFNEVQIKKNRGTMDLIKNMITCNYHSINIKGVPQFDIKNIHNYLFTSNKHIPLVIEADDRRFTILKPTTTIKSFMSQKDLDLFDDCLKNPSENNKYFSEFINFGNYLVNNKNIKSNIKTPLNNETKKILTTKSISLNQKFINELKELQLNDFCDKHDLNYKNYLLGVNAGQYLTTKKLIYKLYNDFYKQHSDKFEFAKRKDQVLDELQENKIFIALGNESRSVKLINTQNHLSYRYLFHYAKAVELYLDEREIEIEKTEVNEIKL